MSSLPKGFSFVHHLCPSIRQMIRYSTDENFLGRVFDGYSKSYTCLTNECLAALSKAQEAANVLGYDLLIYDGYRPFRACKDTQNWLKETSIEKAALYYPNIEKSELFHLRYLYDTAEHCFGSAVDITLIRRDKPVSMPGKWYIRYYQERKIAFYDDGSMDMYSSFDLFDPVSAHDSILIPETFLDKRNLLRYIMESHGFTAHKEEWWHYTLINPPFHKNNHEPFDFVF